jgi:shikimate kinase
MIISLIGFMASGKTSLGQQLAQSLHCEFVDLDQHIEEKEGKTVAEIFAEKSEAHFRELEEKYLEDLLEEHISDNPQTLEDLPPKTDDSEDDAAIPARNCTLVLSVGGGCVMSDLCAELLDRFTYCIYLETDFNAMFSRLEQPQEQEKRPLVAAAAESGKMREQIEKIFRQREPHYRKLARKTIRF